MFLLLVDNQRIGFIGKFVAARMPFFQIAGNAILLLLGYFNR